MKRKTPTKRKTPLRRSELPQISLRLTEAERDLLARGMLAAGASTLANYCREAALARARQDISSTWPPKAPT